MRIGLIVILSLFIMSCGENTTDISTGTSTDKKVASAGSDTQQTFKWKLVTTWPKNYPGLGTAPENFAKKVDAMSGGRLKIKVYGAGQLVVLPLSPVGGSCLPQSNHRRLESVLIRENPRLLLGHVHPYVVDGHHLAAILDG